MSGPESHIQHAILEAWGHHKRLRLARINTGVGWFANGKPARKTDPGAYPVKFGVPGTADVIGLIWPSGRMLAIEVKSATGKLRKAQETFRRVVEKYGGLYIVARSLAEVDDILIPIVGAR